LENVDFPAFFLEEDGQVEVPDSVGVALVAFWSFILLLEYAEVSDNKDLSKLMRIREIGQELGVALDNGSVAVEPRSWQVLVELHLDFGAVDDLVQGVVIVGQLHFDELFLELGGRILHSEHQIIEMRVRR